MSKFTCKSRRNSCFRIHQYYKKWHSKTNETKNRTHYA